MTISMMVAAIATRVSYLQDWYSRIARDKADQLEESLAERDIQVVVDWVRMLIS